MPTRRTPRELPSRGGGGGGGWRGGGGGGGVGGADSILQRGHVRVGASAERVPHVAPGSLLMLRLLDLFTFADHLARRGRSHYQYGHTRAEDCCGKRWPPSRRATVEQNRSVRTHGAVPDARSHADNTRVRSSAAFGDITPISHHLRIIELAEHTSRHRPSRMSRRRQEALRRHDVDPIALQPDPSMRPLPINWKDLAFDRKPPSRAGSHRGRIAPAGRLPR